MTEEWAALAERAIEEALHEVRDGGDPAPALALALDAWAAACGDASPDVLESLTEYVSISADAGLACVCPPGLVARGGFRSGCPVHGGAV